MVKPLCSFTVCQVVTLRDVGFSWSKNTKATQVEIKIQCTVCIQTLPEKQQFRGPNRAEDPPNCQKKSEKKLVADVLKDPKTSLERIRVAHNAFSCYETISRGTVRRNLKKYGVFSRNAAKKSV